MFVSDLIAVHKDRFQIQRFVQNHQIGGPSNLQDAHIQAHGLGGRGGGGIDGGLQGQAEIHHIASSMEMELPARVPSRRVALWFFTTMGWPPSS